MDFIMGLPSSDGKMTIMVVINRLSKHAHFSALGSSFTALQVAEIMIRDVIRLHGIPAQIIFDHDPVFMSWFWGELFRLHGTLLTTSSAYHLQTDGQIEVLNWYLEDYLWCFTGNHPRQWVHFLPWVEWHYNTAWHSAIGISLFEAIFGRAPPSLIDYLTGSSTVAVMDDILTDRTELIATLYANLQRVQQRMKDQANAGRTDIQFHLGY